MVADFVVGNGLYFSMPREVKAHFTRFREGRFFPSVKICQDRIADHLWEPFRVYKVRVLRGLDVQEESGSDDVRIGAPDHPRECAERGIEEDQSFPQTFVQDVEWDEVEQAQEVPDITLICVFHRDIEFAPAKHAIEFRESQSMLSDHGLLRIRRSRHLLVSSDVSLRLCQDSPALLRELPEGLPVERSVRPSDDSVVQHHTTFRVTCSRQPREDVHTVLRHPRSRDRVRVSALNLEAKEVIEGRPNERIVIGDGRRSYRGSDPWRPD